MIIRTAAPGEAVTESKRAKQVFFARRIRGVFCLHRVETERTELLNHGTEFLRRKTVLQGMRENGDAACYMKNADDLCGIQIFPLHIVITVVGQKARKGIGIILRVAFLYKCLRKMRPRDLGPDSAREFFLRDQKTVLLKAGEHLIVAPVTRPRGFVRQRNQRRIIRIHEEPEQMHVFTGK